MHHYTHQCNHRQTRYNPYVSKPNFSFESQIKGKLVIGLDEVGRGALAGPVTVAAVSFKLIKLLNVKLAALGINDSKKLSKSKREELDRLIKKNSQWAIAQESVTTINSIGITKATAKAFRKAIKSFKGEKHILLDGYKIKYLHKNLTSIVKGDQKSISIAAASIIAKVHRDKLMAELGAKYPQYKWHQNAGYGTKDHINALKTHGPTKLHRKLFIKKLI